MLISSAPISSLPISGTPSVGGVSYEASPGTIKLTGQVADVVIQGNVAYEATPGAIKLTGQTADVLVNHLLEASPGAITLTGATADVLIQYLYEATPGTIKLTGATADFVFPLVYQATPGTIFITGAFADVKFPEPPAVPAGPVGRKHHARYPRTIVIGKRRYVVETPTQEMVLLRSHIAEEERLAQLQEQKRKNAKARIRQVRLTQTRVQKLASLEPDVEALLLQQLDEELILILGASPWL